MPDKKNIDNRIIEFPILKMSDSDDNLGWIEKFNDGTLKLMTTYHENPCELTISELDESIEELEEIIKGLKSAKKIMGLKGA